MKASFMLTTQRQNCNLRNGRVLCLQDKRKKTNWRNTHLFLWPRECRTPGIRPTWNDDQHRLLLGCSKRLRENVRRKRAQKWWNHKLTIHQFNALAHRSLSVSQFLVKKNMAVIPIHTRSGHLWPFSLPQDVASDEGSNIQRHWKDSRGIAACTWHNSKMGLPGMLPSMAETLVPFYSGKMVVLWRWWRNLTSKISKLLFTSTILELLDTPL